jgi:predicted acetyltransferase
MEIRAITEDEVKAFRLALIETFGGDPEADPQGDERFRALVDRGRSFAAFERGQVIATAAAYDFEMTVPGGSARMGGLTMVTVRPTHRRQGLLRRLIAVHLDDVRRRGEAISGLWASDAAIYGRFGYGIAAESEELSFDGRALAIADAAATDGVEQIDEATATETLPGIYDQARPGRPGMLGRSAAWWLHRRFRDRAELRNGASPRRYVVTRRGERPTGYAVFRHKPCWTHHIPTGTVEIEELVAVDAPSEATLWRHLSRIDLFPNVSWWNAPVDSGLPWIVSDTRQLHRRRNDALWLRIDDVAAALPQRRYAADGALRLAVIDPGTPGPAPAFELQVEGGAGRCAPTDSVPDLAIDRAALGSLYLGAFSAAQLARFGRIRGTAISIATMDRLFRSDLAPWSAEIF